MQLQLAIIEPSWQPVYRIPRGTTLLKGRHGLYHEMIEAASSVRDRYGCYAWHSDETIFYCGRFAKDYTRSEFKSNLHGRVHNYLQNHGGSTNKMVFDNINLGLSEADIMLSLLRFKELLFDGHVVSPEDFAANSNLVQAVEALLICSYRAQQQCAWNRT